MLGSDAAHREVGCTAATRARQETCFYGLETSETDQYHERGQLRRELSRPDEVLEEFGALLDRNSAQTMAIDRGGL